MDAIDAEDLATEARCWFSESTKTEVIEFRQLDPVKLSRRFDDALAARGGGRPPNRVIPFNYG